MRSFPIAKVLAASVALVAVISVVLLLVLSDDGSGNDPLTVDVFAQQYSWSFGYPSEKNAFSKELHVPVGSEVQFEMHSQDVVHSFWVPEWRINKNVVPGLATIAALTPEKVGTYQLICAQLCGIEHASMRAKVVVETPAGFEKWVGGLNTRVPAHLSERIHLDSELESIHKNAETNG